MNLKNKNSLALILAFANRLYHINDNEPGWTQIHLGSISENYVTVHAIHRYPDCTTATQLPTLTISLNLHPGSTKPQ